MNCNPLNAYEFVGFIEADLEDAINAIMSKKLLDGAGGKPDFLVVDGTYLYIPRFSPVV